jgi:murein DD-endopeptidase MepM/ murein hydrolase activator NlpD
VVHLIVELPESASEVKARVFDRTFTFFPGRSRCPNCWEGLIGIDLGVEPGNYNIEVSATRNRVLVAKASHGLEVLPKKFPVRRITVEDKYVSPPPDELERIRRESKMVSGIFSKTTRERLWTGTFSRPVPGDAISSFGKRSIINGRPRSPHSGTDFRAAKGTPIKAPNAGKVLLVRDLYFAGGSVILDHGLGLYSYFAHLSKFLVSEGELVEKGDVVGEVGATGRVTGPHLHWTLRLAGARVDPLSLMAVLEDLSQERQP